MKIIVINKEEIIEGLTASITFPLLIYVFRYMEGFTLFFYTSLSWFITWILRKLSVNLFKKYKLNNTEYFIEF